MIIIRNVPVDLNCACYNENTIKMAEKNDQVPEVTVETLGDKIVVTEQNILDTNTNEGQLKRPPSATPRNRSPVTIQEWVDSLPTTVSQK